MKASEARKIAEQTEIKGLKTLYSYIKNVAANGERQTTISIDLVKGLPELIVKKLRDDGYDANFISDQRDGSYYKISW